MCIFTGSIDMVSSTNIFTRMQSGKQLIVYDMYLQTQVETAMVLPIPALPGTQSVDFVDLSDYTEIFNDIEALFTQTRSAPVAAFGSRGRHDLLPIIKVGSFEASFVSTQRDFAKLDPRFRINDNIFEAIPRYEDYCFVVFKLKPGESRIHPMAFWFATRHPDKLFYPTVHVHDRVVHEEEHFSHILYAQGELVKHPGLRSTNGLADSFMLQTLSEKSHGVISETSELYKQDFYGIYANEDIWFELNQRAS